MRVFHHRDDTRVHLRPSVCAASRFAAVGTTALHLLKESEAMDTQHVQHILDTTGVRLVKNNHYTFHNYSDITRYRYSDISRLLFFLYFEVHEDEFLTEGFLFVAVAMTRHDAIEHRHDIKGQEG